MNSELESKNMVVRIKGGIIDQIEDTETKYLKFLKVSSQLEKATITLELPEALCSVFKSQDPVNIKIDSKPMLKGEKAKLYVEGAVFRIIDNSEMEVTGTLGGLRFTVSIGNPTPTKRKTFESDRFFLMIS
jgi:hypothetical protein